MADHCFESRLWVAGSRPEVFAFLATPERLPALTPAWLRLRLLAPAPLPVSAGTAYDCRIRWLGLPLTLRMFVREWDPPFRFLDVQLCGPFARWEHRHLFLEEEGGTRIEDRIVYRLPFGPLGRLAHALLVRRQLDRIWCHRTAAIAARFGPIRAVRV